MLAEAEGCANSEQEIVVEIANVEASYTWGNGSQEHFLDFVELHIAGACCLSGSTLSARVTLSARAGNEPEPYDRSWHVPGASVGRIELGEILQLQAFMPRQSIKRALDVLRSDQRKELHLICSRFERNHIGSQVAELVRFTLSTTI